MLDFVRQQFRNASWYLMFLIVTGFGLLIVAGVAYAVASRLVPNEAWPEVRCWAGMPLQGDAECWQSRLKKREAELRQAHQRRMDELAALRKKEQAALERAIQRGREVEEARTRLDERLKRAERIEENWNDINLFTMKSFLGGSVHTGVKYPSIVKGQIWENSWCYFNLPGGTALEKQIRLGNATPSGGVVWREVSEADLANARISRENLEAAKALCSWPDGLAG